MDGGFFLQAFLVFDVFVLGIVTVLAWQYGREHFNSQKNRQHKGPLDAADTIISAPVRQRLAHEAETRLQQSLAKANSQLEHDLGVTSGHINNLVMRLATEIVSGELERYREDLTKLHQHAETALGDVRAQVSKHQTEIETEMAQELEAEKQKLLKQIDTKLADAVGSFLTETLGHNVDLGNQSAYLMAMLEEHKKDFLNEVGDGTKTAQ